MKFRKPRRWVNRVFIHCSAASRSTIDAAEIDSWHKQRGWSGIGYHYFIKTDGTLELGRDLERTPAAQRGHNSGSIAICLNGLDESDFTQAQLGTLRDLCRQIDQAYRGKVTFHGHKEVANKACPVFDYKNVLGLDWRGHLPDQYPLRKSRTMQGSALALTGGAGLSITDGMKLIDEVQSGLEQVQAGTVIGAAVGVVVILGAAFALYARWDDAGRPSLKEMFT